MYDAQPATHVTQATLPLRGRRLTATAEATVSLRWVIPFMRLTGASPADLKRLEREGINLQNFADPQSRISHQAILDLLERSLQVYRDPWLGLRAGERFEPGDYDAIEYAARSCASLREAIHCTGRYMPLMHGAQESRLHEDATRATWRLHVTDGVRQPAAVNDFALASAVTFARRNIDAPIVLREVHLQHPAPAELGEYTRVFGPAELRFEMAHNALVFDRALLDAPMKHAHAGLQKAFEQHAASLLERLTRASTVAGRVRELLLDLLRGGDVGMANVAHLLGVSAPTLRRRLREEGTAYDDLLDELRRELAEKYLRTTTLAISEITFLLGFAHVSGFYKAFSRWSRGSTPSEFRALALEVPRTSASS